jgi:hypothetical protein
MIEELGDKPTRPSLREVGGPEVHPLRSDRE